MERENSREERYKVFNLTSTWVSKNAILVCSNQSGKSRLISPSQLQFLRSCQTFASLTAHTERYCQKRKQEQLNNQKGLLGKLFRLILDYASREGLELPVPEKEIEPFRQQLQDWVEEGFLVSESELRREIKFLSEQNLQSVPASDEITVAGIPTCGRPETLKRCLDSFTGNFTRHGRSPDILILDDSRDETEQHQNQAVLRELNDRYDGDVYYMDRSRREAFARAVARKAGVEPEIMQFALMGHPGCNRSEGGCRNAFLLLTQGQLALQTDDDTICRIARSLATGSELVLTSESSSDDYWFFQSHGQAIKAVDFIDEDFLGIHEQMVGKRLGNIMAPFLDNGGGPDIDKLQPSFLRNMESDNAAVRMSLMGPVGDTCLYTDLHRLFLEGDSLQRLLYPEEAYPWHLSTRQVIRGVTRPTISSFPRCIGMNFATDNRALLPPFMPVQARCDGIFGDLLAVCFPGAYAGNIPWVLAHQPPGPRPRSVLDVFRLLELVRVNDIVAELIYHSRGWPYTDKPEENLQLLGLFLKSLASHPKAEFAYRIRQIYAAAIRRYIQTAEQFLHRQTGPNYWRDHLQRMIDVKRRSLFYTDFSVPADIARTLPDYEEAFREVVHYFGRLLMHWPEIWRSMEDFSREEINACLNVY